MRPSSSPSIPLSSASKLPSVSLYERYERIFQCDGGCITEDNDVSMYQYRQSRSHAATDEQNSNNQITTTKAIPLNLSSSYQGASRKHQQESPPLVVTTVRYKHQARYNNDEDTFNIDEQRRIQSRTKAAQTEAANNEYFHNRIQQLQELIHNSNDQSQITQMPLPILSSPDTTIQQQQQRHQQQQQCQCHSPTPIINSNKTYATPKPNPKSKPVHYEMCTVVMPSNFRVLKGRPHNGGSGKQTDDSESTESTQSMSESEDDDLSSLESHFGDPDEKDTLVSILRRRTVVKYSTNADTHTKANDSNRVRRVVQFEKDTQFPDPNERPSSTRKHVPRMSQRQKQEYDRMNNNNTYPRRRRSAQHQHQPNVSSLLIQLFLQHRPL
mmetsp:Transcript_14471/g.16300  ORF Transcript_14471/g.16300 Transcript_14471/m.16300 type:complete len:383 (-) Transcript_14471:142-1290(-)